MSWKNSCRLVFLSVQARVRSANPKQEAAMIEERIAITIKHAQSRDLADFALSRFIIISNTWKLLKGARRSADGFNPVGDANAFKHLPCVSWLGQAFGKNESSRKYLPYFRCNISIE